MSDQDSSPIELGPFEVQARDANQKTGVYSSTFHLFPNASEEIAQEAGAPIGTTVIGIDEDYSMWPGHTSLRAHTIGYRVDDAPDRASYRAYQLPDGTLYVAITRQLISSIGSKELGRLDWSEAGTAICSIRGVQIEEGKFNDLKIIWNAMRFIGGLRLQPGGRKPTPKQVKIDKLAEAGLKWFDANHKAERYVTVEDFGRPEMGEATGRGEDGVNKHMNRNPKVYNDDIWNRMHEMITGRESAR